MKSKSSASLVVLVLLFASESHAVYKCDSPSGPIYQDSQCSNGTKLPINSQRASSREKTGVGQQQVSNRKPLSLPKIGSSWGDAITHMGRQPDRENSRQSSLGASHQLVFNYEDGVVYLYIRNGVLESASEYDR